MKSSREGDNAKMAFLLLLPLARRFSAATSNIHSRVMAAAQGEAGHILTKEKDKAVTAGPTWQQQVTWRRVNRATPGFCPLPQSLPAPFYISPSVTFSTRQSILPLPILSTSSTVVASAL